MVVGMAGGVIVGGVSIRRCGRKGARGFRRRGGEGASAQAFVGSLFIGGPRGGFFVGGGLVLLHRRTTI